MKIAYQAIGMMSVLLVSIQAQAGQKVNESLPATDSSFIQVEHKNGKAEIRGWDKNEVKVEGELSDRTEEFIFRERNGDIRIKVEVKGNRKGWSGWDNDEGDDLLIFIPFGASLNYESINARVTLRDLTGASEVDVINGSIDAKDMEGRIRFESVNGEIEFENLSGDLSVSTVNGSIDGVHESDDDIELGSVNGSIFIESTARELNAETVNGDIELKLASVQELQLNTVNGDIEVDLKLEPPGDIEASTVGGRIELTFEEPISARFDIEAHAGGRITNKITDDKMEKAKYGPRRWLNFTTGDGSSQVELSTVSGRIVLDKKD